MTPPRPEILLRRQHQEERQGGGRPAERLEQSEVGNLPLCRGFDATLESLRSRPYELNARIEQLKQSVENDGILKTLFEKDIVTEQRIWEMVAVLEEYDRPTFEHSLRVAALVYRLSSNENGKTYVYLKEHLGITEAATTKDVIIAGLLHDIGKTAVPCSILHDPRTRREWAKEANKMATEAGTTLPFDAEKIESLSDTDLDHYLSTTNLDVLDMVPVSRVFDESTLIILEQNGIPRDATLRTIIRIHETAGISILRRIMREIEVKDPTLAGRFEIVLDIIANHHGYDSTPAVLDEETKNPSARTLLRVPFLISIIRSADVFDALSSLDRSYKDPYPPLIVLRMIVNDAKRKFTEPELTKRIVYDLYHELSSEEQSPETDGERLAQDEVLEFINGI